MISMYHVKPKFQARLRPMVTFLAARGVTPNQITLMAFLLSIVTGVGLFFTPFPSRAWLLLPLVLLLRMMLNAIDGMLAREHGMQSRLGALLNEVTDVVADAATYLPFCSLPQLAPAWIFAVIWLASLSEFVGMAAIQIGAKRRYDGPMGKSDRALVFGVVALLLGLGVAPGNWVTWLLSFVLLLLLVTIFNRARQALKDHHD